MFEYDKNVPDPERGDMLISEPFLNDPNFERTVILICEHNEQGTFGLVLNKLTDAESKTKFKSMPEEEAVSKLFFSLGRWISYNWSFHDGSRLAVNLQKMGIYRPEDMSRFIMILFHRLEKC